MKGVAKINNLLKKLTTQVKSKVFNVHALIRFVSLRALKFPNSGPNLHHKRRMTFVHAVRLMLQNVHYNPPTTSCTFLQLQHKCPEELQGCYICVQQGTYPANAQILISFNWIQVKRVMLWRNFKCILCTLCMHSSIDHLNSYDFINLHSPEARHIVPHGLRPFAVNEIFGVFCSTSLRIFLRLGS